MGNALHTPGAPGVGLVSAAEARLDDAGLLAVGSAGLISPRTGVLVGPGSTALVTGTSSTAPMQYSVAAHHWVTSRGVASDGVYRGAAEAVKTVATTAAPGSGSRIDVVWVKQLDQYSTLTPDASSAPQYGCTQGTPTTGTPAKPALPTGAEELAVAVVPAGTTRTDTGVTITNTAVQTVTRGSPVPVRSLAEREAIPAASRYKGLQVLRLDTEDCRTETWTGTGGRWSFRIEGEGTYHTAVGTGILQVPHGGGQTPIAHGGTPNPQLGTFAELKNQVINLQAFYRDATYINFRVNRTDSLAVLADEDIPLAWWVKF